MHHNAPPQGDSVWIDWTNECVWRGGEAVRLTPKAFAVLRAMTARAGQLVTKAELLQAVWPEAVVSEAVLTGCIGELRKALGETARAPQWIQTVHRRGYRFLGPVPGSGSSGRGTPPAPYRPAPRAASIIGRVAELAQLHQGLTQARDGARQVVFVTGEAGMGKTTVVQAFVEQVVATGDVWIAQGQCLEHYGAGEAYLPVLEALGRLCRGPRGAACLAVLEHQAPLWLAQMPALLSAAALEAVQRRVLGATRERMVREMADALDTLTQDHPLVLVLEDLHWSDVATLDLLAALAQRPEPARLLLVGTYRPVEVIVHHHPFKALKQNLEMHRQCTELPLELLSAAEVAQYLAARFAVGTSATSLQALALTLYQRTDGHPLFLVTVVDDLVRQGALRAVEGQWEVQAADAATPMGIPDSLRRMIAQQCDALSLQDQQVLEAASVAGQTCSAAAVAAGLEAEVEAVEARGAALVRRGQFLEASGLEHWPDGTVAERYRWRHTLYQEVLYDRLPAGRRLRLHQRIGWREEAGYGAQASARAAALAEHFVRGRDDPRAVQYLQQAARNALQRYAYQEAIGHLTRGLAVLQTLPATPERVQQELAMQATLGMALMTLQGYSAPDVERAYTRACALAQQVEETPHLFPVLWGLWAFYFVRGELQTGYDLGEQLLSLAHRAHDPGLLLEAHLALGANLQQLGEVVMARSHLEQALALVDPQQHRAHAFVYGHDPQVVGLADLACVLWVLGYPDQAWQRSQEALTVVQTVDHTYSRALAHFFAAWCAQLRRDPQTTAPQAAAVLMLAHEHAFQHLAEMGLVFQGWAVAMQGQATEGIAQMRQGLAAYQAIVGDVSLPHFFALLAEASGQAGQTAEGLALLAEALVVTHHTDDRWYEAELHRLQGELLLLQSTDQAAEAEACFQQALTLARRQQAKSLELRAAMSLSRLWQQQDKREEARALLAPIYGWFTEGFDTADLQEARALLEAWAG